MAGALLCIGVYTSQAPVAAAPEVVDGSVCLEGHCIVGNGLLTDHSSVAMLDVGVSPPDEKDATGATVLAAFVNQRMDFIVLFGGFVGCAGSLFYYRRLRATRLQRRQMEFDNKVKLLWEAKASLAKNGDCRHAPCPWCLCELPIDLSFMDGPFERGGELLRCGHVFHERCISQRLQVRNSCPVCRKKRPRLIRCGNVHHGLTGRLRRRRGPRPSSNVPAHRDTGTALGNLQDQADAAGTHTSSRLARSKRTEDVQPQPVLKHDIDADGQADSDVHAAGEELLGCGDADDAEDSMNVGHFGTRRIIASDLPQPGGKSSCGDYPMPRGGGHQKRAFRGNLKPQCVRQPKAADEDEGSECMQSSDERPRSDETPPLTAEGRSPPSDRGTGLRVASVDEDFWFFTFDRLTEEFSDLPKVKASRVRVGHVASEARAGAAAGSQATKQPMARSTAERIMMKFSKS